MNVTPLMALPYPNPAGAPCDFDEEWCAFTSAIDGVFDRFEAGLARTFPAIPAAVMQLTSPVSVVNQNPIPFDTVQFDNAGMTNMDADPFTMVIPRSGMWTVAGHVVAPTAGGGTQFLTLNAHFDPQPAVGDVQNQTWDRGLQDIGIIGHREVTFLAAGTKVTLSTFLSSVSTRVISEGWLAAYWHADLETP